MEPIERSVRQMLSLVSANESRTNESLMAWSQHLLEQLGELRMDLDECNLGRRYAQTRR